MKRKAAERVAESNALAVWQRHNGDGSAPVDVVGELSRLAAELTAFKDWAAGQLAALTAGHFDALDLRTAATLALWERSLDRAARVLSDMARLKIEARLTRVTELQVATLIRIMDGALRDCGYRPDETRLRAAIAARARRESARGD